MILFMQPREGASLPLPQPKDNIYSKISFYARIILVLLIMIGYVVYVFNSVTDFKDVPFYINKYMYYGFTFISYVVLFIYFNFYIGWIGTLCTDNILEKLSRSTILMIVNFGLAFLIHYSYTNGFEGVDVSTREMYMVLVPVYVLSYGSSVLFALYSLVTVFFIDCEWE